MNSFKDAIKTVSTGYRELLLKFALIVAGIGAIVLISVVIALPIWYFATHEKTAYGYFILAILILLVAAGIVGAFRNQRKQGIPARSILQKALKTAGKTVLALLILAGIPTMVMASMNGFWYIAIPFSVVFLFLSGLAFFPRKKR